MFPFQNRRTYGQIGAARSEKRSRNKKKPDIFYDPEGTLAAPGAEGNIPAKFDDFDVHMDDWESNKEQIAPKDLTEAKEEVHVHRVYLNPRRPSSKKFGARTLAELSVDALYPTASTFFTTGKPKTLKGPTVGKPPMLKTFTPASVLDSTNSEGSTFRVPAVPEKYLDKAKVTDAGSGDSADIDLKMKDRILPNIQTSAPPNENKTITESDDTKAERSEDNDEECKENQPPHAFLRGVDPNSDRGFRAESPFGSDLPHLNTPYPQEPILANDPSSKFRAPISVNEAMAILKGNEPGSVPVIREGALGELSAEHLYLAEPSGLVFIPSTGLQYRYDSSTHFVPTMTMESGLKDLRTVLSNSDPFEIWNDGEEGSDDERKDMAKEGGLHGRGNQGIKEKKECNDDDGDDDDEDELDEDEYEALLKLHFGDGWTENSAESPASGTILVRSQASADISISYSNITTEEDTGLFPPPAKLRILHRSPGTDRGASDVGTGIFPVKTAGIVEVTAQIRTLSENVNDENASPLTDMDPFALACCDENEIPPGFTPIPLHTTNNENHSLAISTEQTTVETIPQKSSPHISKTSPGKSPQSPSAASSAVSPLTVHSPPNPNILSVTATKMPNIMDSPLLARFPASFQRSNSFREFRDPLGSPPIQIPQQIQKRPTYPNDQDDDERFASLHSGSPCGTDGTHMVNRDNDEMLSQLNLICLQASDPTINTTISNSPTAETENGTSKAEVEPTSSTERDHATR